jgi:ribosomal protein S18 acetylase RimI-like enzyme
MSKLKQLSYVAVGAAGIDRVRSLWEKLRAHHADLSPRFGEELRVRTFDTRKQQLLAKADAQSICVDLVFEGPADTAVAYCITTVSCEGIAEIDSIYVEEHLRGQGVGSELMRRALAWLSNKQLMTKIVSVMSGNNEALAFYRRFGFYPRTISLQESHVPLSGEKER